MTLKWLKASNDQSMNGKGLKMGIVEERGLGCYREWNIGQRGIGGIR